MIARQGCTTTTNLAFKFWSDPKRLIKLICLQTGSEMITISVQSYPLIQNKPENFALRPARVHDASGRRERGRRAGGDAFVRRRRQPRPQLHLVQERGPQHGESKGGPQVA